MPLILLLACAGPDELEATVVQAERIDSVLTVSFQTDAASVGWVEWGDSAAYGHATPRSDARAEHHVRVAGLPVASTVHWRAAVEIDGVVACSADATVETSPAPPETPGFTLRTADAPDDDFIAVPTVGQASAVVLLDRQGRVTWYKTAGDGRLITNASFSRDGTSVLYGAYGAQHDTDQGTIERVSLDQEDITSITTPAAHHDFVELPEGGYAYLKIDVRDYGGQTIVGDSIVELDADGDLVREVWNSWDVWTPDLPCVDTEGFYPQGCDWLHGNALSYDEAGDQYVYSARNLNTVVFIDRESGAINQSVGQFGTLDVDVPFRGEHSSQVTPQGTLLVFDNGADEDHSSVREYQLGETLAEQVWSTSTRSGQWCFLLGDQHRYDDGDTLISWGTVGYLAEVDPAGEEVWRVEADVGNIVGFLDVAPTLGGEVE